MIKWSSFLNPFTNFFETKTYPKARLLRTSLWQKIADTYCIFGGTFPAPITMDKKDHVGLLDYVTLGIPCAIGALNLWSWEDNGEKGDTFLNVITVILTLPTNHFLILGRILAASILTAVTSPLVAILHWANKSESNQLQDRVNSIPVLPLKYSKPSETVGKMMQHYDDSFEDFHVDCVGTTKKVQLIFKTKYLQTRFATADLDLEHKKDRKAFTAFLKLNIGGLAHKLEKRNIFYFFSSRHKEMPHQKELFIDTVPKLRR